MLKRVTLRNIQTHRKATFDLDRIVTFIGENDSGKSAIIRSMFWAAFNQPPGDEIIHWDADSASVKLEFDDCTVVRKRGVRNLYLLNKKPFRAFGAGKVPDTVAKAVRLDDINFQQQLDAHFWFSDTAGTVSKQLNRVVDLSIIDLSLAASESGYRRAKQDAELCRKHLKQSDKTLEELKWVPTFLEHSEELRGLQKHSLNIVAEYQGLSLLLERIEDAEETERKATKKATHARDLDQLCKSHSELAIWCASLEGCLQEIAGIENLLLPVALKVPYLDEDLDRLDHLEYETSELVYLVKALDESKEKSWEAERSLTKIQKAISEETEGRCPVCGNKLATK